MRCNKEWLTIIKKCNTLKYNSFFVNFFTALLFNLTYTELNINLGVFMAEVNRETVVVDGNRSSSFGWLIALGVIVLLVILFFAFGGANLFNGAGSDTQTINVDTPDSVQVQPAQP